MVECGAVVAWPVRSGGNSSRQRWPPTTLEDCHVTARLERALSAAGCRLPGKRIVRVPPQMTARHRQVARTRGKPDPIDAVAAARATLAEPDLPVAGHGWTGHLGCSKRAWRRTRP
ncbi:hypothetical protein GCM10009780_53320 [Actinomadura alba]